MGGSGGGGGVEVLFPFLKHRRARSARKVVISIKIGIFYHASSTEFEEKTLKGSVNRLLLIGSRI